MPRQTPAQAAHSLYAVISRALSQAALEDYGITATPDQADRILRELLSLCLFWAWSALDTGLSDKDSRRVFAELQQRVRRAWASELGLRGEDVEAYFKEFEDRRATCERITSEGGTPVAVATDAAGILETETSVAPADRPNILALLIDLVPVDELGETVEGLTLAD